MPDLTPPEDQTITTLFVGNVGPSVKEADIRDKFYSFGEIKSIKRLESAVCAFVTFTERSAAERVSLTSSRSPVSFMPLSHFLFHYAQAHIFGFLPC